MSAFDRRRTNGPEKSLQPVYEIEEVEGERASGASASGTPGATTSRAKGKLPARGDRKSDEVRSIFLQTGLIPQASGSAYVETEKLKIACAVYGPRQVRGRQYSGKAELNVELRFAPFASERRRGPGKDVDAPSVSSQIQQALLPSLRLDLLPKASLDVYLTVLEADASEDGCAALGATAASAALADAGVEMYGLVVGCVGAYIPTSGQGGRSAKAQLCLDPTRSESLAARGQFTLWTMPALGSVTGASQAGVLRAEEVDRAMDALVKAASDVHFVVAKTLSDSFQARSELNAGQASM